MLKLAIIDAITKYIEDNLEKHKINTDLLSIYTGFSRRYLQLLFKKHLGIPIAKYIQLRRVSRAAILLKLTNAEIIDISNQLFYDSQQTFSREFKKTLDTHQCDTERIKYGLSVISRDIDVPECISLFQKFVTLRVFQYVEFKENTKKKSHIQEAFLN